MDRWDGGSLHIISFVINFSVQEPVPIQRISVEVTNRCQKGCPFCYNASGPRKTTRWTASSLIAFVLSCHAAGTKAVSFGGGEPLLFEGIFQVLEELEGVLFRSLTTNGLLLEQKETFQALVSKRPDKVHISIHDVENDTEVKRVLRQVKRLEDRGITSGINLLIRHSTLSAARDAAEEIRSRGIGPERVIYIPMHGADAPSPEEVADAAGGKPFQSVSCLKGCRISPRFCSISWDQTVGWCSYTSSRSRLQERTASGLASALQDLPLVHCENHLPRIEGEVHERVSSSPQ